MSTFNYKMVETSSELERALEVRRAVFVEEQGVEKEIEYDGRDIEAEHIIVTCGELTIGTARVRFPATGRAKIERMAVLPLFRCRGVGRGMLSALTVAFREQRIESIVLHAQNPVVAFYETCGYRVTSAPFIEANIKHVVMEKSLDGY